MARLRSNTSNDKLDRGATERAPPRRAVRDAHSLMLAVRGADPKRQRLVSDVLQVTLRGAALVTPVAMREYHS